MARDPGVTRRVSSEVARRAFSVRAIGEIVGELRRVTWPTREETFRLSIMVCRGRGRDGDIPGRG